MEFIQNNVRYVIGGAITAPILLFMVSVPSNFQAIASSPRTILFPPTVTPTPLPSPTPTSTPTPTETPTPRPTKKPTPKPTPTPTPYPVTSAQLEEWFTKYANYYSIERKKLWLMAVCESELRPNARSGIYGGLYQFSGSTWRSTRAQMNVDPDPQLRFNPEEAIKTAAFKISTSGLSAWPNCKKAE
jgi:hypothetical protein